MARQMARPRPALSFRPSRLPGPQGRGDCRVTAVAAACGTAHGRLAEPVGRVDHPRARRQDGSPVSAADQKTVPAPQAGMLPGALRPAARIPPFVRPSGVDQARRRQTAGPSSRAAPVQRCGWRIEAGARQAGGRASFRAARRPSVRYQRDPGNPLSYLICLTQGWGARRRLISRTQTRRSRCSISMIVSYDQ